MTIDKQTVLKTAKLCRIQIRDHELENYTNTLSRILDVVDTLFEVDTTNIEPLVNVNESGITLHEDVVTEGNQEKQVLANAPKAKFGYFSVPKVIE